MHTFRWVTALSALLLLNACSTVQAPARGDLLIEGATLIDTNSGLLSAPKDVLIKAGTIVQIADSKGKLSNAVVAKSIAADGLFLLPGLIDVHAHIGDGGLHENSQRDREQALQQFLRYGVTTIFVPGGGGGNEDHLRNWKQRCSSGELVCPQIFGSGSIITAYGSHPITTVWGMSADNDPAITYARGAVSVREDEPVEPIVKRMRMASVDALKIVIEDGPGVFGLKPRLSRQKIEEIVAAARANDLRVYAHVSLASHVEDAVAAGANGVMHSSEETLSEATLMRMAEQGMFYVATLALYDAFADQSRGIREQDAFATMGVSQTALDSFTHEEYWTVALESEEEVARWMSPLKENLRRASAAGVPLALGTDTNNPQVFPGFAVHEELELMVDAGLSPQQALAAATVGGARFLQRDAEIGKIAVDYRADMLLLDENPMLDIAATRSIVQVIANGLVVDSIVSTRN